MWGCGLKLWVNFSIKNKPVTPYVGVWIEILDEELKQEFVEVTPYVGVWIEML